MYTMLLCCSTPGPGPHRVNKTLQSAETHEVASRTPNKNGYWASPPQIYVCKNAPVNPQRLSRALKFWNKLGYKFGVVLYDDETYGCIRENLAYGAITIDLVGQKFKEPNIGMTWNWRHTKTNEIVRSRIELKNEWGNSARVLEHEIGHSLGWLDYKKYGHLMNHDWSAGGMDTQGLEYRYAQIK